MQCRARNRRRFPGGSARRTPLQWCYLPSSAKPPPPIGTSDHRTASPRLPVIRTGPSWDPSGASSASRSSTTPATRPSGWRATGPSPHFRKTLNRNVPETSARFQAAATLVQRRSSPPTIANRSVAYVNGSEALECLLGDCEQKSRTPESAELPPERLGLRNIKRYATYSVCGLFWTRT